MVSRRAVVVGGVTNAIVATRPAWAQPSGRIPWIVFQGIGPLIPGDKETVFDPFRDRLRALGYVEGRTIEFEFRHVGSHAEQLPAALEQLVRQKVDVIVCGQAQVALAAKRATQTIPIVFATIIDPVGAGIVKSLSKPGGNATGISWDADPKIAGKQLELVHGLVPGSRVLAIVWNPEIKGSAIFVRAAEDAAHASGATLQSFEVRTAAEIERAFIDMGKAGVAAVVVLGSDFTWIHREQLATLAAAHRVPAIYGNRDSVTAGGLMSYGANLADQFRRAADYVDKILKGANPADLPVEQPTRFEFVVNLKAASTLGIAVPQALLLRADEVLR